MRNKIALLLAVLMLASALLCGCGEEKTLEPVDDACRGRKAHCGADACSDLWRRKPRGIYLERG